MCRLTFSLLGGLLTEDIAIFVGFFWKCAMTPIIFIATGFLCCWFLLYTLMEWTQNAQGKAVNKWASRREIKEAEYRKPEQILRKQESRRVTCV